MPHPPVAIATKAITLGVNVNIGTVCPDYWLLLVLHTLALQFVQTTGFYWYYTHSRSSLSRLLALDTLAFLLTLVPTEVDRGSRSDQRTSLRPSLALSIQALESHMFAK